MLIGEDMGIYLLVFNLSIGIIYVGEKLEEYRKLIISKVFYFIGILAPSILAGIRDYTIGTDVNIYGVSMFNEALRYSSFQDYIIDTKVAILSEPLYKSLNYIISRFTNNPSWILFLLSLLTVSFVFMGFYKYKKKFHLWWGMFLFYFTFFNMSLNIMRQLLASSILFFSIHYIFERKIKKYYLFVILGVGFHASCVIGIVLPLLYSLINNKKIKKYNKIIILIIIFFSLLFIANMDKITIYLVNFGLLRDNYLKYINPSVFGSYFSLKRLLLNIFELFLIFLFWKKIKKFYPEYIYVWLLAILGFIFSQIGFISTYIIRISYYFIFIRMYLYSIIPYLFKNKKDRLLIICGLATYFVLNWIYVYAYLGEHETIPYKILSSLILRII